MGATSEDFIEMREQEYMINATFKVKGRCINEVEDYLLHHTNLINYKVMPNTDELYKNDPTFKKLVKAESQAKRNKEIYIHNKQ